MNIVEILKEYIKTGEILKIVYNGGSQPGTIRELVINHIKENSIKAAAPGSKFNKEYKIDKIEIYDELKHQNAILYITGKKIIKYLNYQDILDLNNILIQDKELVSKIEENDLGLYSSYKNGNIKKRPEIAIEYHEFVYEEYYDPETDDFKSGKHKSQKPWCVKAKGKTTRNYKHFEKAAETFAGYIESF